MLILSTSTIQKVSAREGLLKVLVDVRVYAHVGVHVVHTCGCQSWLSYFYSLPYLLSQDCSRNLELTRLGTQAGH